MSADVYDRKECYVIGKIKSILLGVLCAVCLQVPLNVGAVELPIIPVEDSQAETTTAYSKTPAVTQKPSEQNTSVQPEAPAKTTALVVYTRFGMDSNEMRNARRNAGRSDCIRLLFAMCELLIHLHQ